MMQIHRMRAWGVKITPEIARNCMAHYIDWHEKYNQRMAGRISATRHASVVYYMRLGNRVKIGVTTNISQRVEAIRPEEVLAMEPGDREIEQARHKQFADLRTHGEWFRHEPPLSDFIEAMREYEIGAG